MTSNISIVIVSTLVFLILLLSGFVIGKCDTKHAHRAERAKRAKRAKTKLDDEIIDDETFNKIIDNIKKPKNRKKELCSKLLLPFLSAVSVVCLSSNAIAENSNHTPICGAYETFVKVASEKYHERLVSRMLSYRGLIIEIWASKETGTYSMFSIDPSMLTCYVDGGDGFSGPNSQDIPGLDS